MWIFIRTNYWARQRPVVNKLRPNRMLDEATARAEQPPDWASGGVTAEGLRFHRDPPLLPEQEWAYSETTANHFEFGSSMNEHQMHYLRSMAELLRRYKVQVIVLHIPVEAGRDSAVVSEALAWKQLFGPQTVILGLPSKVLFLRDYRIPSTTLLFRDPYHFNENGFEFFSAAIIPAILPLVDAD